VISHLLARGNTKLFRAKIWPLTKLFQRCG
jgi:hypothetical protein